MCIVSLKQRMDIETFTGVGYSLMDTSKKQKYNSKFDKIKPRKMKCRNSKPKTRIQLTLIGGKREILNVNGSSTVLQIYAHVKAISDFKERFYLLTGYPPTHLNEPYATVNSAALHGSNVVQKAI